MHSYTFTHFFLVVHTTRDYNDLFGDTQSEQARPGLALQGLAWVGHFLARPSMGVAHSG